MLFSDLPVVIATPLLEKHCTPNDIAFLRVRLKREGVRCFLPTERDFKRLAQGGWIDEHKTPTSKALHAVEDYELRHELYTRSRA